MMEIMEFKIEAKEDGFARYYAVYSMKEGAHIYRTSIGIDHHQRIYIVSIYGISMNEYIDNIILHNTQRKFILDAFLKSKEYRLRHLTLQYDTRVT